MKLFKPLLTLNTSLSITNAFGMVAISATLLLSGCSVFSVYKIDLPQGTPITQTVANKLQVGMTKNQVLYYIGSPAVRDTLAPNRWDYIYDYTPGTYGKREGIQQVHNAKQHLTVYFDNNGLVTKIEGIESLPTKRR